MRDLLSQYRLARKDLKKMLERLGDSDQDDLDREQITSMINSVSMVIDWLETGRNPYFQQGIDIRHAYDITRLPYMDILPDIKEQVKHDKVEMTKEQIEMFREIISLLSNREWECFVLHYAMLKSMSEIAEELQISKSTVQEYIERAKNKIDAVTHSRLSCDSHTN